MAQQHYGYVCRLSAVTYYIKLHEQRSHIRDDVKQNQDKLKTNLASGINADSKAEFSENHHHRRSFLKSSDFTYLEPIFVFACG